jgi:Fe-S-cluster containining protein
VEDGYVFLKPGELERIAQHLDRSVEAFSREFGVRAHPTEGTPVLEAKDGRGCPLLTADRKCSVHPVKPSQCAAWPFWPDMVADRELWDASKSYCPGLDRPSGRKYGRLEILAIVDGERGT